MESPLRARPREFLIRAEVLAALASVIVFFNFGLPGIAAFAIAHSALSTQTKGRQSIGLPRLVRSHGSIVSVIADAIQSRLVLPGYREMP
jgi:hypothetical protein